MGDVRGLSHHDGGPPQRPILLTGSNLEATIAWLIARGHAADLVLVVIASELVWLVVRGGWRARDAVLRLGPGALMLVSLRAALTGLDWRWIALPLALSFPLHLADLARGRPRPGD